MKTILMTLLLASATSAYSKTSCVARPVAIREAPANSLQSLMRAVARNADGVAFDLRHTSDEVPVLMHDKTLSSATHAPERSCPLTTAIRNLSYKQIRDNCILSGKYPVRVPSLEEALHLLTGTRKLILIHLRDAPTAVTEEILYYYFQDYPENLRLSSLRLDHIQKLKQINPENKNFWKAVKASIDPMTVNNPHVMKLLIKLDVDFISTDEIELCKTWQGPI